VRRFQAPVRYAALDKRQDRANQSNQGERLLFESGKRSSIPARVPGRRDWPRYRSKRGAASERPYRKLSVERFEPAEQLVRRGREVADARAGCAVDGVDHRRACAAEARSD
jgi:hypothetical protein